MRLTVLGGCGAWAEPAQACSGFLVELDGFRLVLDMGYATMPRLLEHIDAESVDAVYISHGHPDHCADLNPLLRARAMSENQPPPLPVYSPAGALDAVLALDRPQTLAGSYELHDVAADETIDIGPFRAETTMLPHWLPNLGIRLSASSRVLAYTGDSGPSTDATTMARDADLLIADATNLEDGSGEAQRFLSTPSVAGHQAAVAGAARLLLTHLWPGTDHAAALTAARAEYGGVLAVAIPGLVVDLG